MLTDQISKEGKNVKIGLGIATKRLLDGSYSNPTVNE